MDIQEDKGKMVKKAVSLTQEQVDAVQKLADERYAENFSYALRAILNEALKK